MIAMFKYLGAFHTFLFAGFTVMILTRIYELYKNYQLPKKKRGDMDMTFAELALFSAGIALYLIIYFQPGW